MKIRSSLPLFVLASGLFAGSLAQAATYYVAGVAVADLGDLGSPLLDAGALDVNNRGEIVGYSKDSTVTRQPFIWRAGVMTAIPVPATSARSVATGINDAGEVVGIYGESDEFNWRAFHWSATTGTTTLVHSLYPGLPFDRDYASVAHAINKSGNIAGMVESRGLDNSIPHLPCFRSLPVVWKSKTASPQILHCTAAGDGPNYGVDINNSGWIVGTDTNGSDPDFAFVWKAGITSAVPAPVFGTNQHAEGINETGTVVGYAALSGVPRAMRWDGVSLSSTWLPLLPGGTRSYAVEVNDQEFIAGTADKIVGASTLADRAFLWHADFGMFALPLPAGLPATSGCSGNALNNRLQTTGDIQIVGTCSKHAIRWTVRVGVRGAIL